MNLRKIIGRLIHDQSGYLLDCNENISHSCAEPIVYVFKSCFLPNQQTKAQRDSAYDDVTQSKLEILTLHMLENDYYFIVK